MSELLEVAETVETLRDGFEALFVRGVAASSPADRKGLSARAETWERAGAQHVAGRVRGALAALDADARDAPSKLLGAYTSLHLFERLLSLDVAKEAWDHHLAARGDEPPPAVAAGAQGKDAPPLEDPKGTAALLDDLTKVAEDLVRTGLSSATTATRTKLDASFAESSKRKLLRLGASLRYVSEEVGRFLADDGSFNGRRYAFFLHRAWLLARGTRQALKKGDGRLLGSLSGSGGTPPRPPGDLDVVTLGIAKRTLANACTFDMRLRVVAAKGDPSLVGQSLVFSLVFARKGTVAAEAYLLLPQPQKYLPRVFREHHLLRITDGAVLPGRLVLGPKSTVTQASPFTRWTEHYSWDPAAARARVVAHSPSPLDLAVEMQEEMVLRDWELERAPGRCTADKVVFALRSGELVLEATLPKEAKDLAEALTEAAKKKKNRPPLFGTVHYELGRLAFTPLAFLHDDGPEHVTLSKEKINLTELLGSLDLKA